MDVDATFRKCIRIQKQNQKENFVLLQVFMITTSRAIALLPFSYPVPLNPIPEKLFWANFVATNILEL